MVGGFSQPGAGLKNSGLDITLVGGFHPRVGRPGCRRRGSEWGIGEQGGRISVDRAVDRQTHDGQQSKKLTGRHAADSEFHRVVQKPLSIIHIVKREGVHHVGLGSREEVPDL